MSPERQPPLPAHDGIARRVQPMALDLLDRLARRIPHRASAPDAVHVQKLLAAVVRPERQASLAAVEDMKAAGLSPARIVDGHVPAVAEALGEGWKLDRDSFTTVTVGGARLQWLVRMLDRDVDRHAGGPSGGEVLVLTVAGADHTLGAVLLASQMRRRGLGVRLMLGAQPHGVASALRKSVFDAVMISAAPGDSESGLAALVRIIRATSEGGARVPVVLGGGILADNEGIAARVGADLASGDLDAALLHCGLRHGPGLRATA